MCSDEGVRAVIDASSMVSQAAMYDDFDALAFCSMKSAVE